MRAHGRRALVVRSKADLGAVDTHGVLETSATTGAGLDALKRRVLERAGVATREGNEDVFVTTTRQHAMTVAAREALAATREVRRGHGAPEIAALELRQAATALADLRGIEVGDRVLDEVFARFCIGK